MGTLAPQHNNISSARAQHLSLDILLAPTDICLGIRRVGSTLEVMKAESSFPIPQVEAGASLCFPSSFWVRWVAEGAWIRPSLKPTVALKQPQMWIWRFCFIICSEYTVNQGFWAQKSCRQMATTSLWPRLCGPLSLSKGTTTHSQLERRLCWHPAAQMLC